jgi:hypothetical protein
VGRKNQQPREQAFLEGMEGGGSWMEMSRFARAQKIFAIRDV